MIIFGSDVLYYKNFLRSRKELKIKWERGLISGNTILPNIMLVLAWLPSSKGVERRRIEIFLKEMEMDLKGYGRRREDLICKILVQLFWAELVLGMVGEVFMIWTSGWGNKLIKKQFRKAINWYELCYDGDNFGNWPSILLNIPHQQHQRHQAPNTWFI